METVKVSEILDLVRKIHKDSQTAIHYLEGRILIGEINRPEIPAEKKPRKKRVKKATYVFSETPVPSRTIDPLPDADKDHPFYGGAKRGRKKKEISELKEN